ncbi:MAG TPA: SsrA-binding protein SmpB [Thermoanaerobaculia bacterium]|nr:SsrA-binding protein SmpB [Thermoanaerobaculia bacterium]
MSAAATRPLASNRKASHDYHLLERFEAGLALTGTEVKAARMGRVQLKDSFVEVREGEAYLVGAHISPYSHGNRENHDPERTRKLLLTRREIDRLQGKLVSKGLTVVPLEVYLKGNRIKLAIALAEGKKQFDKRQAERDREHDREMRDAFARAQKGKAG